jgi:hypothetical protein
MERLADNLKVTAPSKSTVFAPSRIQAGRPSVRLVPS